MAAGRQIVRGVVSNECEAIVALGGIGKPFEEFGLVVCIAGGGVECGGRPGQLVIVGELIAVVSDPLIAAVFSVFGNGVRKEIPAFGRRLHVSVSESREAPREGG